MKFGSFLAQIKKDKSAGKKSPFFALKIDEDSVQACLWLVENGETHVLISGSLETWSNEEELLQSTDSSLSSIDEFLKQNQEFFLEPSGVILGLPASWIETDKIIPLKLKILKKTFRSLDLKPIGFVATHEAVSHFFKAEEGVPLSGILVELKEKKLCLTLVKLGKIKNSEEVIRSRALQEDLLEGLFRLKEEMSFPARVLIFGLEKGELEDLRQRLIDYPWADSGIDFLHLPKVELLAGDLPIQAIALAGGRETAGAKTLNLVNEEKSEKEEETGKTEAETDSLAGEEFLSDNLSRQKLDLGFVKNKDINQEVNQDIDQADNQDLVEEETALGSQLGVEPELKAQKTSLFSVFGFFRKFSLPRFSLPKSNFVLKSPLLLVFFLLFGIFVLACAGLWFLPKATVDLYLESKTSETDFLVQVEGDGNDEEMLTLSGQTISVELSTSKSQTATGIKLVGDPAVGKVTIYNRTSQSKVLPQGTILTGPDDLEFTLDEEVTVASQSAGEDYSTVPGKAESQATAVEIGTEGNLAAKAEFGLANFARSDFVARNEEAFSGGISREVQAVADQDLEDLEASLTQELEEKALSELRAQIVGQKELIENSLTQKIVDRELSAQVGDQAQEVSLDLTIEFFGLVFSRQELKELANSQLKDSVPEGFVRLEDKDEFDFSLEDPESSIFRVVLKTTLVPTFDLAQIKKELKGKKVGLAQEYLLNLSGIKEVKMSFVPRLPELFLTLPRVSQNITIETKVN